jgi:hypothetical protein
VHLTGQSLGLKLSDDNLIVWLFWQFFWIHQVVLMELAMLKEE